MLRETKEEKIVANKAKREKKALTEASHGNTDLFERLRKLRRDLAEENNVPPYVIFGDKSLHDMCMIMPRSKDEFLMVNGVGQMKCEKYGEAFLGEINHS